MLKGLKDILGGGVLVHVRVHVCRKERWMLSFSTVLHLMFWNRVSHWSWLISEAGSQQTPGVPLLSSPPSSGSIGVCHHARLVPWMLDPDSDLQALAVSIWLSGPFPQPPSLLTSPFPIFWLSQFFRPLFHDVPWTSKGSSFWVQELSSHLFSVIWPSSTSEKVSLTKAESNTSLWV